MEIAFAGNHLCIYGLYKAGTDHSDAVLHNFNGVFLEHVLIVRRLGIFIEMNRN